MELWDFQDQGQRIYGKKSTCFLNGELDADCRIVRDDRVQGGGIQSTLEAIVDSSGRMG